MRYYRTKPKLFPANLDDVGTAIETIRELSAPYLVVEFQAVSARAARELLEETNVKMATLPYFPELEPERGGYRWAGKLTPLDVWLPFAS